MASRAADRFVSLSYQNLFFWYSNDHINLVYRSTTDSNESKMNIQGINKKKTQINKQTTTTKTKQTNEQTIYI